MNLDQDQIEDYVSKNARKSETAPKECAWSLRVDNSSIFASNCDNLIAKIKSMMQPKQKRKSNSLKKA